MLCISVKQWKAVEQTAVSELNGELSNLVADSHIARQQHLTLLYDPSY